MSQPITNPRDSLATRIEDRSAIVGIIGMGYVGLPLALCFTEGGFHVIGFDVDPEKVAKLNHGEGYIKHLNGGRIAEMRESRLFEATGDFLRLGEPDAILICVPTPLTHQRQPDMTYVEKAGHQVKACLRPGQLIVLESTTYPGTTEELLKGIIEESGLRCGEHFFLGFSPEREDPGRKDFTTTTTPKVVGGVDDASADLVQALYDKVIAKTVRVSSARVAEATKLTENIFRAVNIALVNELKVVYDRMDIDIWEVLDAAETKPFGFMRFNPGPGWGGHCIPLDPFYLSWKALQHGMPTKFIELAGDVNVAMPHYVVAKLQQALSNRGKTLGGSRILLLGIAYKKDIDDPRESPAFEIIELLLGLGAQVSYHDPHLPVAPHMRTWPGLPQLYSTPLTPETLRAQEAVVVVVDHTAVDYDLVLRESNLVIDTRGVYRARKPNVVKA